MSWSDYTGDLTSKYTEESRAHDMQVLDVRRGTPRRDESPRFDFARALAYP
jgi:hypothetical protein